MTGQLSDVDRAQDRRAPASPPSPTSAGLELFDAACRIGESLLPARLDSAALRAAGERRHPAGDPARPRSCPAPPRRRGATGSLAQRLAGLPEPERQALVLELVRAQAAAVLGHASPGGRSAGAGIQGARLRLADRRRAAQPPRRRHRPAAAARPSSSTTPPRWRWPEFAALSGGRRRQQAARPRAHPPARPQRRADRDRRDELPLPGRGALAGGALGARRRGAATRSREFPDDRGWDLERLYDPDPDHPGTSYAREGGFVDDAGEFDAAFFGISPREALAMDPQQRLLLEAAWEALEDAGHRPRHRCAAAETGVFAGVSSTDYGADAEARRRARGLHRLTGTLGSVVSGRVAYTLGLEGPAVTVDTACSSSLVALHLACQALRAGRVLAGAGRRRHGDRHPGRLRRVQPAARPGAGRALQVLRGRRRRHRLRPRASGLLLLERLSDARRNGHRVLAVVRGSAVNQDGATNGLTAPNGPAQERVIRQALANAGLAAGRGRRGRGPRHRHHPRRPDRGAGAARHLRPGPRGRPLWLGSIKSNIGHTQAAAGVAGVIKMVMALRTRASCRGRCTSTSPPRTSTGRRAPSRCSTEPGPGSADGPPRRAGVSSFGISGTNAHVILEEAPEPQAAPAAEPEAARAARSFPGCSRPRARRRCPPQAERLLAHLQQRPGLDPLDVGFSLATSRAQLEQRAVVARRRARGAACRPRGAGRGRALAGSRPGQRPRGKDRVPVHRPGRPARRHGP